MKNIAFLFLLFTFYQSFAQKNNHPNIVFIMADDMGYGDLSCYNSDSKIPTPNIDNLAESGVRFMDAHAAGAWCVPSRYGLITGSYPGKLPDLKVREHSLIKPAQETLATLLKRNGYQTACIGKWHLGFDGVDWSSPADIKEMKDGPTEKGFDYFFGLHASLDIPPYFYIENDHPVQPPTKFIEDHSSPNATSEISGAFFRAGAIAPDFKHKEVLDKLLEKALGFLDNHQKNNPGKPFFLYFPLTAPHTPWLPKDKFIGKSGAGEYGDFAVQVDDLVGQVMAYLRKNNLLENTIVFFTSDNGPVWFPEDVEKYGHSSVGVLRGMKGDMWEGGSRIPFIVSDPSWIKKGKVSNQMICFTDMMATLADLVGDDKVNSANLDSHSFLPELRNSAYKKPARNDLIIEKKSFRQGDWKYISGYGQGGIHTRWAPNKKLAKVKNIPGELYNLKNDISEKNNLYDKYPDKVKVMKKELNNKLEQK